MSSTVSTLMVCSCGFKTTRNTRLMTKEDEEVVKKWCLEHVGHALKMVTSTDFSVEDADELREQTLLVLNDVKTVADVMHDSANKVARLTEE